MRIGWTGYNTLRREMMAPIGAVDQYYTILPGLRELSGEPVHWLQLKHLDPDAHTPNAAVAEDDEIDVHQCVYHYGDNFKPMMQWVNSLPTVGRMNAAITRDFDWGSLKYEVPYLDVVIVEATGQMGAAYGQDALLRALWKKNPNIGFVIFDQDLASPTVKSKMRKWHTNNPDTRQITATHYTLQRYPTQAIAMTPHLEYRNWQPVEQISGVAYVGNDYKRREPMLRLMQGPYFHHFGRLKSRDDFASLFTQQGVTIHGPFVPTKSFNIEHLYRSYGAGVHCLREDAYRLNLMAVRLSEIARAGCFAFVDSNFQIGKVLSGEWAMVKNAAEILEKARYLYDNPSYMQDFIRYQQGAMGYYTSSERYIESIWRCCQRLCQGAINGDWHLNLYSDLMRNSGLGVWGATS